MNRLKRYLPLSAMKLMYDSLILSHLQFGITNWGFEWDRISKLQKRALRIMTNSRYNAHTEPLCKQLHLLKVKDIFEIQCLKFWYKFVNNKLPNYITDFSFNVCIDCVCEKNKWNHSITDIAMWSWWLPSGWWFQLWLSLLKPGVQPVAGDDHHDCLFHS